MQIIKGYQLRDEFDGGISIEKNTLYYSAIHIIDMVFS